MTGSAPSRLPPATRPLAWVASILYVVVLLAGGYVHLTGPPVSPVRTAVFVGGLGALVSLELVEWRRWPIGAPRPVALTLLAVRSTACLLLSTLDPYGFARALLLLIPFTAYFVLGAWASYGLAAALFGVVVGQLPAGWPADQEHLSDLLMFTVGLVFAVSMASVAARAQSYAAQTRAYASQVAELAAEAERNRLARDLHDSLGHHLTAISVQLEKVAAYQDRDPGTSAQALANARASVRQALADVRHSVGSLRGGRFSLRAALAELVRTDPAVELHVDGDESDCSEVALLTLYRVAQEALTNARRHAGAGRVTIRLALGRTTARLVVTDDGRGFDPDAARSGHGLRGMRERIGLVGGTLAVTSRPGAGTEVTATVPTRPASARSPVEVGA